MAHKDFVAPSSSSKKVTVSTTNCSSKAATASLSPGAPEARLARRKLAWRACGSPGAPEARLASRRLALVSSAFQNNQLARLARWRLALVSSAFQTNQLALASQGRRPKASQDPPTTHGQRAFSESIAA